MTRRVLVTGASGFIGSHLTQSLLAGGHEVRALVRYSSSGSIGWLEEIPESERGGLEIVLGDVRDAAHVHKVVAGCQVVYHLAALIAIPYSYQAPASFIATNVEGTLNVLQAACDAGVERFVHTSTSEVYGSAQFVPISETHPLNAQSPYAASKAGADQLALSFHSSFGLPVSVIRPFNTFGPRQSARAVIPTIIEQLLSGRPTIKLGALNPTRDLTFVKDTVAAFTSVARADGAVGEVINIGSGFEIAIGELLETIKGLVGSSASVEVDEQRLRPEASEVDRLCADVAKARRLLDWQPAYSGREGLLRGLRETVEWFQRRLADGRQPAGAGAFRL